MDLSRRALIGSLSALPLTAASVKAASSLPDKASYEFSGTYLNAAYVHPMNRPVRQAGNDFFAARANRGAGHAVCSRGVAAPPVGGIGAARADGATRGVFRHRRRHVGRGRDGRPR